MQIKCFIYLMTHATHFIYGYMALDAEMNPTDNQW